MKTPQGWPSQKVILSTVIQKHTRISLPLVDLPYVPYLQRLGGLIHQNKNNLCQGRAQNPRSSLCSDEDGMGIGMMWRIYLNGTGRRATRASIWSGVISSIGESIFGISQVAVEGHIAVISRYCSTTNSPLEHRVMLLLCAIEHIRYWLRELPETALIPCGRNSKELSGMEGEVISTVYPQLMGDCRS